MLFLDKDGNVVTTPETGDGGWQSAGGKPTRKPDLRTGLQ